MLALKIAREVNPAGFQELSVMVESGTLFQSLEKSLGGGLPASGETTSRPLQGEPIPSAESAQ